MEQYLKKLFQVDLLFLVSGLGTFLYKFLFPQRQYFYGAAAVLVIMILDLGTKLFSLSRQGGGIKAALVTHKISSSAFARGTTDKLLVYGIMLIICGCAYRLTVIDIIAIWFTQLVYTLMFLRDLLSILENLNDAGVGGLKIFKSAVEKKMSEYTDDYKEHDDK
ncbi:MAG: phage holin family protein [Lachnospiraceae bacterium]|nr:phage holin family protein [Lachnospiraceae bacterium]